MTSLNLLQLNGKITDMNNFILEFTRTYQEQDRYFAVIASWALSRRQEIAPGLRQERRHHAEITQYQDEQKG